MLLDSPWTGSLAKGAYSSFTHFSIYPSSCLLSCPSIRSIQKAFLEHSLCVRPCAKHWGHSPEPVTRSPCSHEALIQAKEAVKTTDHHSITLLSAS